MVESNEVKLNNLGEEDSDDFEMVSVDASEAESLKKIGNAGGEKKRYDKPTNMTIDKVSIAKNKKIETSNDGDRFVSYRINIFYSDGSKEGLGGFRGYLDEKGNVDRFWSSEKSAGGEVKKLLEVFLELENPLTFMQFAENLKGQGVRVRSKDWAMNGQKGFKNLPIEFVAKT